MDGRWKRWACAGLIAGALGCNRNAVHQPQSPVLPGNEQQGSLLERAFGNHPRFTPQVPPSPEPPLAREPRKSDKPFDEPDTYVALADASVAAAFMEGRSAVDRDKLLDSARHQYQGALRIDPKHKGAMTGLAKLYGLSGDKERAIDTFRAAVKQSPKDHDLAHKMAAMQVQFGDWAGAAESCRYALSLDPENRTYTRTLGYCQAQLGQWQEAGETLMRVMPEAQARYFLGRVLIDQDRVAEGRQMIQQAAAQDPHYEPAQIFLAEFNGGSPSSTEGVRNAVFDGSGRTEQAPQPSSER
jgi:tetratricopeptide (TPR) repeat protein